MTNRTVVRAPSVLIGRVEVSGTQWIEPDVESGGVTVHSKMVFMVRLAGLGDAIAMLLANRARANIKMMPHLITKYLSTKGGTAFLKRFEEEEEAALSPSVASEEAPSSPEAVAIAAAPKRGGESGGEGGSRGGRLCHLALPIAGGEGGRRLRHLALPCSRIAGRRRASARDGSHPTRHQQQQHHHHYHKDP